jgi:hypothetical protein
MLARQRPSGFMSLVGLATYGATTLLDETVGSLLRWSPTSVVSRLLVAATLAVIASRRYTRALSPDVSVPVQHER